jgi:cytochrome P450
LEDELFKNDSKMIIDQCLTFFFAGSQTGALTTSNMIIRMFQNPETIKKTREEFDQAIRNPYMKSNPGKEFNL